VCKRRERIGWVDLREGSRTPRDTQQLHNDDEQDNVLKQRELEARVDMTALGIQETHYWSHVFVPDVVNTAFIRLNDDELLMYNIGPLTDDVLRFLKTQKIQKVHHIMCCNGEVQNFLVEWINGINVRRDQLANSSGGGSGDDDRTNVERMTQRDEAHGDGGILSSDDTSNSTHMHHRRLKPEYPLSVDDEEFLPELIHYQFTSHGKPAYHLSKHDQKYLTRVASFSQLPPILRDNFKFSKVDMAPSVEEVIFLHPKTKTLFTTFLTRNYTDAYKGTPSYTWVKWFNPDGLNRLTTVYAKRHVPFKIEFRDFLNEVSEWDFENLFMVQGKFIKCDRELPAKWREAQERFVGPKYDSDEKL